MPSCPPLSLRLRGRRRAGRRLHSRRLPRRCRRAGSATTTSAGVRPRPCIPPSGSVTSSAAAAATPSRSGFAALDAELPGGGWPRRVLSELLLPHAGVGEIRLLAPALVAAQRAGRLVMVFDPPAALSAPALAGLGFDVERAARRQHAQPRHPRQRQPVGARAGAEERPCRRRRRLAAAAPARRAAAPPPARRAQPRRRRLRAARGGRGGAADGVAVAPGAAGRRRRSAAACAILKRRGPPLEAPLQLGPAGGALGRGAAPLAERARARPRRCTAATFVNFA